MAVSAPVPVPTRYGPVTFTVTVDEAGAVTQVDLPLFALPDALWQLTYGADWPAVRAHFEQQATTLRQRAAVMLWLGQERAAYGELRAAFAPHRAGAALPPEPAAADRVAAFKQNRTWRKLLAFDEPTLAAAARAFAGADQPAAANAEPLLRSLLPLYEGDTLDQLYAALGATATPAARETLLAELERPGYHLATTGLLRGLRHFSDDDTRRRVLALYDTRSFSDDRLDEYLGLLGSFRGPEVVALAERMLRNHPYRSQEIVSILRKNQLSNDAIARLLREQFDRETDFYALDPLLGFLNALGVPDHAVDLGALNERAADVMFTDLPQVSWPQQLGAHWRELLLAAEGTVAMTIATNLIASPLPRLQRNGLLQLHALVQNQARTELPGWAVDRLGELFASRFDKVSTVALKIAAEPTVEFGGRPELLHHLLKHSLVSRYRLMVGAALRNLLRQGADWAEIVAFYRAAAADPDRREGVERFLRYLRRLGDVSEIIAAGQ